MAPLTTIVVYSHTNCLLTTVSIKVTTAGHIWIEPLNSDLNTEKKNFMSYLILTNFSQNKSKRGHVWWLTQCPRKCDLEAGGSLWIRAILGYRGRRYYQTWPPLKLHQKVLLERWMGILKRKDVLDLDPRRCSSSWEMWLYVKLPLCVCMCVCVHLCVCTHMGMEARGWTRGLPTSLWTIYLSIYCVCVCCGRHGIIRGQLSGFHASPPITWFSKMEHRLSECLHPESHQSYCFEIGSYWTWDSPAQLGWLTNELLGAPPRRWLHI